MTISRAARLAIIAFLSATGAAAVPVEAQNEYEILHAFRGLPGRAKAQLLEASDGQIYGVTTRGGRAGIGAIFALRPVPGGFNFRTVYEFAKPDGGEPLAAVIEVAGELYGTASTHGAAGHGTIFKITGSGQFVLLHTFQGADGSRPVASLVRGSDGAFYGTTKEGGAHGLGTVFRMTADGALATLKSFDGVDGAHPGGPLVQAADGHLYGTTGRTQQPGFGTSTIFRIAVDGTFTPIHSFTGILGPVLRGGLVAGLDGHLYGAASPAVPLLGGTMFFRVTTDGVLTPIHTTDRRGGDAGLDHVPMSRGADGNFYGTLPQDGIGNGTAYRLTPAGEFTVLHDFTAAEGASFSGLIQARDGLLYGATFNGGIGDHGLVFRLSGAETFTHLHHFTSLDGDAPYSPPVRGPDSAFYGTTVNGGLFNKGTIYRLASDGTVRTLHSFNGLDGAYPFASLVLASDGLFYGAAVQGGCAGLGTIFRVRLTPTVTVGVLHCFQPGEGREPFAPMIQAADGHLYGTTVRGGAFDTGTIFRVTVGGTFTTLSSYGMFLYAPLIEGPGGRLYGTTAGQPNSFFGGTVFSIGTDDGIPILIHQFTGPPVFPIEPGPRVFGGVAKASDGSLYVPILDAALYQVLSQSVERVAFLPGKATTAPIQASDGNFYGTTIPVGLNDVGGRIYRFNPADGVETLKSLGEDEGAFPSALTEAPDGSLLGATVTGGPALRGVLFRFRVK